MLEEVLVMMNGVATINAFVSKATETLQRLCWRSDDQVVLRTSRASGFVQNWKTSSKVEAIVVLCWEQSFSNGEPANTGEVEEEGLGSRESSVPYHSPPHLPWEENHPPSSPANPTRLVHWL